MATPAVAAERPSSSLSPCLFRFAHTVLSASARQPGCSAAPARSVLSPVAGLTTWRRSAVDWVKGDMNVEWCNKTGAMKYLFKYVTKGPDFSELYLQTPPSVMKPPEPSDGKSEIGSEVKRALFTEMSPKQPEEELAPEILSKELGLPASDAPDSPPASSAGPSVDNSSAKCKQPQTQPDGAGKKKKT